MEPLAPKALGTEESAEKQAASCSGSHQRACDDCVHLQAASAAAREEALLQELGALRTVNEEKVQALEQEIEMLQQKLTRTSAALAKERKGAEAARLRVRYAFLSQLPKGSYKLMAIEPPGALQGGAAALAFLHSSNSRTAVTWHAVRHVAKTPNPQRPRKSTDLAFVCSRSLYGLPRTLKNRRLSASDFTATWLL